MTTIVDRLEQGIGMKRIKIPLPNPLKWVNSYLIQGSDGYTLIDPGQYTEDAIEAWHVALSELRLSMSDIRQIIVTHHHPDHYGLAGWLQEQSGAPVWMSKVAHEQTQWLWGAGTPATEAILKQFAAHGMDSVMLAAIHEHLDSFVNYVNPQPEVRYLEGDSFQIGDRPWQMMVTNGHASGHVCFYQTDTRELLIGDQVLPQISPNISYLPDHDPAPLASFITSLQQLSSYDVSIVYPGHRHPFQHLKERVEDLLTHHEERLRVFQTLLTEPRTAYECCLAVFSRPSLTVHQLRFAMAETIAHLVELEQRGLIRQEQHPNGIIAYRA